MPPITTLCSVRPPTAQLLRAHRDARWAGRPTARRRRRGAGRGRPRPRAGRWRRRTARCQASTSSARQLHVGQHAALGRRRRLRRPPARWRCRRAARAARRRRCRARRRPRPTRPRSTEQLVVQQRRGAARRASRSTTFFSTRSGSDCFGRLGQRRGQLQRQALQVAGERELGHAVAHATARPCRRCCRSRSWPGARASRPRAPRAGPRRVAVPWRAQAQLVLARRHSGRAPSMRTSPPSSARLHAGQREAAFGEAQRAARLRAAAAPRA